MGGERRGGAKGERFSVGETLTVNSGLRDHSKNVGKSETAWRI